jgi:hypothetical protein
VKSLSFICLALGLSIFNSATAQAVYKRVSVCEVLAEPQKHQLRYVAIDANLFIVQPDGMALFDKRCLEKGLGVAFPTQGADESVANLERLIRNGKWPMESTGLFRGKIILGPKSKRPVLSLRSVLNLSPKGGQPSPPDVPDPTKMGEPLVPESPHAAPPVQP